MLSYVALSKQTVIIIVNFTVKLTIDNIYLDFRVRISNKCFINEYITYLHSY